MADVSFLIPARNEVFLAKTIDNVLANIRGDSEIIAVLDGAWANPPIPDHPRVRLIYLPQSIGQRAATNLAARASKAAYVCKLDAHCAIDEGFDVKLIQADRELDRPDVTQIPAMNNLQAFNWRCRACGRETYQGPEPTSCAAHPDHDRELAAMPPACGESKGFERVLIWEPRRRKAKGNGSDGRGGYARTEFWRFDHEMHFFYNGPIIKGQEQDEIADVMSSVGACFFMRRDRFVDIDGLDTGHGSWGGFGTEIACKSWLSGGRHVVNRRTHFSHLFRTQGNGFTFPYEMRPSDQEYARRYSQNLWHGNLWPKQTKPLSWLVEYFAPVRGWHSASSQDETDEQRNAREARLADVRKKGRGFRPMLSLGAHGVNAGLTPTQSVLVGGGQQVSTFTDGLSSVVAPSRTDQVIPLCDNAHVVGVAATGSTAHEVVDDHCVRQIVDQPREHQSVNQCRDCRDIQKVDTTISVPVGVASPQPAAIIREGYMREQTMDVFGLKLGNDERLGNSHNAASSAGFWSESGSASTLSDSPIVRRGSIKGIIYYSDCRGETRVLSAVQNQLRRASAGIPIVSCTLQPIPFGRNIHLPLERGYLTMFRQILAALEASDCEYVFHCEHDCLYHASHFDFTPPRHDRFYYNQNTWRVDAETGRALFYYTSQVSGLCASRDLLIDHYRKRVAHVERNGFNRNLGFEPGTNRRVRSLDPHGAEIWMSPQCNIDIKTRHSLTPGRWSVDQFRNKNSCLGWTESDRIPGWGVTLGRVDQFLAALGQSAPATEGAA